MDRAGHFCNMSSAQGMFFPNEVPSAGYPERSFDYASFPHSSENFWLDDLKGLIAANIPVIVLMTYEPDGGGGHYGVAIGYDDTINMVYLSDPWGREWKYQTNNTGIIAWTYDDFQISWNYTCEREAKPYCSMIMMPWQINIKTFGEVSAGSIATVTAEISYPCPKPLIQQYSPPEMPEQF